MTTELQMLLWTVVLGLVQIAVSASISTHTRGIAWNVGARDGRWSSCRDHTGERQRRCEDDSETGSACDLSSVGLISVGSRPIRETVVQCP